ncbi:DEAD/DEAH box helicase family protein [Pseudomonas putida]|uniref:DEAD/DEAH box helicase family protein n=1 Tax=Pseudomonas putida TaxID=303 RepID=UPI002160D14F|nr:DEAD/DEAH box helicase family protein [Pseudomonas putida]UVL79339.1 DEAD/DEAH box helicase family protein [Pseudomonas putida]
MHSIQALIAPPGAGKTTWLINHINDNRDQRSIIAFPTKHLSAEIQSRLTNLKLAFNSIDSDTIDGSVIQCLEATLLNQNDQIIICTHESLRLIKAETLQDWHLYIDEIPTTWDCDTLSFSDLSYRTALEQFAEPDGESKNRLKAKANCKQLMESLANQADSALSSEARQLLKALLDERYIVEVDELDVNQVRTVRVVGIKQYIPVFEAAKTTVVMGAEIERSLLGVILKGAGWTVTPIDANLGFKGYGNKVTIHPFLAANETYSKSKALLKSGKLEASYKEGCLLDEWLQHDVFRIIGSKKAILVAHSWCNPKLPITEDGQSNIARTNIDSRGLNEYDDYRIAICLQHGNLTPFENDRSTPTLAKLLSTKHEINASDIKDAIKYERFYESTLQSVCRTALRSQADQGDITLFVQDQDIATFLSSKIGNCKVDESYSIAAVRADSAATVNRHRLMHKAITLSDQGHDPHFIAAQINRNVRTVRNWLKSYRQLRSIQER